MVGRISSGGFASGIFDYLDREESETISKNMSGENKEELTKEFLMCSDLNQNVEKPVKHHVISFADEDKEKLNPEKLNELVQDYVEKSGYSNNQYVAYLHKDTDKEHVHIVINKVDFDGKNCHPKFEKKHARQVLMELEEKYNLKKTPEKSLKPELNYERGEKELKDRLEEKGLKMDKDEIKTIVNGSLNNPKIWNKDLFEEEMKKKGVKVKQNKAKNGYNFEYKDKQYKASTIDRKLSFKKIGERLEENKMQRRQRNQGLSLG
jgi:hypothetical protein